MYRDYMCDFICILAWLESDRGTVSQIFYFVLLVLNMVSYLLGGIWMCLLLAVRNHCDPNFDCDIFLLVFICMSLWTVPKTNWLMWHIWSLMIPIMCGQRVMALHIDYHETWRCVEVILKCTLKSCRTLILPLIFHEIVVIDFCRIVIVHMTRHLVRDNSCIYLLLYTMSSVQIANSLADTKACVQPRAADDEPVVSIARPGPLEQTPGLWYPKEVSIWDGVDVQLPVLKPPTHRISVTYYYRSPPSSAPHQRWALDSSPTLVL